MKRYSNVICQRHRKGKVVEARDSVSGDRQGAGRADVEEEQEEEREPQEPCSPFLLTGASFLFTWNVGVLSDPDAESFCNGGKGKQLGASKAFGSLPQWRNLCTVTMLKESTSMSRENYVFG